MQLLNCESCYAIRDIKSYVYIVKFERREKKYGWIIIYYDKFLIDIRPRYIKWFASLIILVFH